MKRITLVIVALVLVFAVGGCGGATKSAAPTDTAAPASSGQGTMVNEAKDNASIAACRTNRAMIDQQYSMAQSTGAGDFASVLANSGARCPSGGSYSWDAGANKTRCSIHGL